VTTSPEKATTRTPQGFDRLRPRTPEAWSPPAGAAADADGKRALFSPGAPTSSVGSVRVDCSSCGVMSVLGMRQALHMAIPSLHLPILKRDYPSFAKCPECQRFTWLRIKLVLTGSAAAGHAPLPGARR
jgi:hypothetical protein